MVEADIGHAISMAVARDLVVFLKRPGGQTQFSAALSLQDRDSCFDRLHGWMANHLSNDLSVPALAARAGMSERTFVRRYRSGVGLTPARAVETLRVEATRQLLISGELPIKRIAQKCGFGSEETLRRSFVREVGITPRDYRERFSAKSGSR
jgi:transcriptional regulator GlxA family with amidase domain